MMISRRHFLVGGGSVFVAACSRYSPQAQQTKAIQSEIILFKDSQNPLKAKSTGAWVWPGTALTANTSRLSADYLKGTRLLRASWVLVWNPKCPDGATLNKSAVRLVSFDNGPTNVEEIVAVTVSQGVVVNTPRVDVRVVTEQLNEILEKGISKQLGHQTLGDGVEGCLIYGSWIELVWSLT